MLSPEEMQEFRNLISFIMIDFGFQNSEFEIIGLKEYGSRTNGKATINSDLDLLLEYRGTASEDTVFNILHEIPIYHQGIIVDINPIKEDCSGKIEDYLSRCDDDWKVK